MTLERDKLQLLRQNPFPVYDDFDNITGWSWYDETDIPCGQTYPTQQAALHSLLEYIHYLNHGPTFWQTLWWPVRWKLWPMLVKVWRS